MGLSFMAFKKLPDVGQQPWIPYAPGTPELAAESNRFQPLNAPAPLNNPVPMAAPLQQHQDAVNPFATDTLGLTPHHASLLHDITHNDITNAVGGAAKNVEQGVVGTAKTVASNVVTDARAAWGNKDAQQQFLKNLTPPPPRIVQNGKQVTNPDFQKYVANIAMGTEAGMTEAPTPVEAATEAVKPAVKDLTASKLAAAEKPPVETSPYLKAQTEMAAPVQEPYQAGRTGTRTMEGRINAASDMAQKVADQVKADLTKAEQEQLGNYLDNPKAPVSPQVKAVADQVRPILQEAANVHAAVNPDFQTIGDYFTREHANATAKGPEFDTSKPTTRSGFQQGRQIYKFKAADTGEELVGTPGKLGLSPSKAGTYIDGEGVKYRVSPATRPEVQAAGYNLNDVPTTLKNYLSDAFRVKEQANYIEQVKTKYGVPAADAPAGYETTSVKGLEDIALPKDTARAIESMARQNPGTVFTRGYRGASNMARDIVVTNPIVHPLNLEANAMLSGGPANAVGIVYHQLDNLVKGYKDTPEYEAYQKVGGLGGGLKGSRFFQNTIDKLAPDSKAGAAIAKKMDGFNPFNINRKIVNAADDSIHYAVYQAAKDGGLEDAAAVEKAAKFVGDRHVMGPGEKQLSNVLFFYNWLRTEGGIATEMVSHPVANAGGFATAALIGAGLIKAQDTWRKETGNPNATLRFPGIFGLIKDAAEAAGQAKQGQVPSIVSSHVNPIIYEGLQQLGNRDFFTGQKIQADNASAKSRLTHVEQKFVGNSPVGKLAASPNKSVNERLLNYAGFSTPHAKGYQAAPKMPSLNKPGTITSPTGDPTGVQQQTHYFDALRTLKQSVGADQPTIDSLNKYLDRNHDPDTGQTIKNSPADAFSNAQTLATNDKLRTALQQFEKSQPNHDPMWDLPADKLQYLEVYKAMLEGSAERNFLKSKAGPQGNNWITTLEQQQQDFYNNLPKNPYSKAPENNAATPPYPTFDAHTQQLLGTYNTASPDERSALIQQYAPELSSAFNQIAQWTNKMRVAQTGKDTPQMKIYPEASPEVQKIINEYNAVPKGGGSKGGNLYRSQWIQSHPDDYAKMQDYLTQTSMLSLVKNAALDQFQGAEPNQQLLKDIKNVGQYDIATTKGADGKSTYSLNPQAAAAEAQALSSGFKSNFRSSGSSKGSSSKGARSAAKTMLRIAKTAKYQARQAKYGVHTPGYKPSSHKTKPTGQKFKATLKAPKAKGMVASKI